ncbi:MAG: hypothetical protein ABJB66_11470 [Gemmatimonadaceae bacterium]
MKRNLRVMVIGDSHHRIRGYPIICEALQHASQKLSIGVETQWVPTAAIGADVESQLEKCDALWCGPCGPYENADGALRAIKFARESRIPFLGTCAGFQHAVIEFARSVIGLNRADHAESNPFGESCVINALPEPFLERTGAVALDPASRTSRIYRRTISAEKYHCAFGLNPAFLSQLHSAGLRVTGVNEDGMAAIVEFAGHPYFLGTLFMPECTSHPRVPHPLITAFLRIAAEVSGVRTSIT